MRVYRSTFKDPATGQQRETVKWYLDFVDHVQHRRRMPTDRCRTRRDAEKFGEYVEQLVIAARNGERPDSRTDTWLRSLSKATIGRFVKFGLIDTRFSAAATPLREYVKDFERWLRTTVNSKNGCKRDSRYVDLLVAQLKAVINADSCRFQYWSDISKAKVDVFVGSIRDRVTQRTCNGYINAIKFFTRWMTDETEQAAEDPLRRLRYLKKDQETIRRALDADELQALLDATEKAPERFGLSGRDRAALYACAVVTGFRVRELQSLKVKDFDLDQSKPYPFQTPAVRLAGEFTKNRVKAEQALQRDYAEQLRKYFDGRQPDDPAWAVPHNTHTTRMLRADLKAAGIPVTDSAGTVITFHSLRHSLATLLDRCGVSLKIRMAVMRHSSQGNMTLAIYTNDASLLEKRDAVEKLPNIGWPGEARQSERIEEVA